MRILILIICLICAYDIYCTVKYSDHLYQMEENLIARMLITVDHVVLPVMNDEVYRCVRIKRVDVSKLVLFKCLGLLAAANILERMVKIGTRWSRLIIFVVFLIQISLFLYLVI